LRSFPSYPTTLYSLPLNGALFRTSKPVGFGLAMLLA
jgi:hypothetical protein